MRKFCTLILLAILASACGQKGALYLPDERDERRKTEEGTYEK